MKMFKKIATVLPAMAVVAIFAYAWKYPNPSHQVMLEWILKFAAAIILVQVVCFQIRIEEHCKNQENGKRHP